MIPIEAVDYCKINHTYSYSLVCGDIESSYILLDNDQKKIQIETPRKQDLSVIVIEVTQTVKDDDGISYTSMS